MNVEKNNAQMSRWWLPVMAIFILAAGTGAWIRFGFVYGFPEGLNYVNIRHAHSHLMYFGWVTPALMLLMLHYLPRVTGRSTPVRFTPVIGATLVASLLTYPPFLLYGYGTATIAGRTLPLSVIAASLNVLIWYAFAVQYWRATRGVRRNPPLRLWDGAVVALLAASAGTWGLAATIRLGVDNPLWPNLFTHLFLDLFAEGWFVLGLLGIIVASRPGLGNGRELRLGIGLLFVGLPFIFLFNLPLTYLSGPPRWLVSAGVLLLVAGTALIIRILWPAVDWIWRIPLFFLGVQAVVKVVQFHPDGVSWATRNGLRIPYLHWLLLGWVTLGLFLAAREAWGRRALPYRRAMAVTVLLLLLALLPLTGLWPAGLKGSWTRHAAAWTALGPVVVALLIPLQPRLSRMPLQEQAE